jgi:hypothetical protein
MSKKYTNMDDLFRDKLKDFEVNPPEYVWEKVQKKMPKKAGKGSGNSLRNGGIAGTALILILTGILSFSLINGSNDSNDPVPERITEQTLLANHPSDPAPTPIVRGVDLQNPEAVKGLPDNTSGLEDKKKNKKTGKKSEKRVKASNPSKNATLLLQPTTTGTPPAKRAAELSLIVQPLQAPSVNPGKTLTTIGQPEVETETDQTPIASPDQKNTDVVVRMNGTEDPSPGKAQRDYSMKNRWSLGLFYTPEMIVYPSDDQMKNYSQSLDILVSYAPGNYFLQSGIGLARYRDQGNQIINYNQYLGSYEDVYNVTFDTTTSGIVPIYHTQTVDVYDSITHVTINPSKRSFTYLQIPLFVGYEKMYKRFGWNVRVGPSVSFLIQQDVPVKENSMEQARILGIENELPGRIQTNWQFILSAGLTYKLGNTINLHVEPMFRYYIRSAYENNTMNTRHPWSAGLRTGLSIRF